MKTIVCKNSGAQDSIELHDFLPFRFSIKIYRTNNLVPPRNKQIWVEVPKLVENDPRNVARLGEATLKAAQYAQDFDYYLDLLP